jgi:fructose-bisphosphate aldolase class I
LKQRRRSAAESRWRATQFRASDFQGSNIVQTPIDTVRLLLAGQKGLLAIDESSATCERRFVNARIPNDADLRRAYREMIVTTPGLSECISGVILHDETIRQSCADGKSFAAVLNDAGIVPGIKVDTGAKPLAGHKGETVTEGLDGLRERLQDYFQMGARFAKWRAVICLGEAPPSRACIEANAHALARYAALCQEAGLAPIIEPEVLMSGDHGSAACAQTTETVLHAVFDQLVRQGVALEALILKPNMVLPGMDSSARPTAAEVAEQTIRVLRRAVPAAVPGIAFLSGGQSGPLATARLNAMNAPNAAALAWALTFAFARAIQQPALQIWAGKDANRPEAQRALLHRAVCNRAARRGQYGSELEASVA